MKIPKIYFGTQKKTMGKTVIDREKEEFKEAHWVLKNANSKQFYEFIFDLAMFPNIEIKSIGNLEETGLVFENNTLSGTPVTSNVYHLDIQFFHTHDEGSMEIKPIQLFVNANPKDLWKNIPSAQDAEFPKQDETSYKGNFLDKKIVVVSKRGRSHAHEGKFRDDDFAVNELSSSWSIVSVSDGAGSAKAAREGARLAVNSVNMFFSATEIIREIEKNVRIIYDTEYPRDRKDEAGQNIVKYLYESVTEVYYTLEKAAAEHSLSINDLHTTLIFTLAKKFEFGYVILSFGVGDCPINLISKDFSEVQLLNSMDVGEFSGGTRFITMKEIFNDQMASRFRITCVEDFSFLSLMTDGIYDPKFVTENKLEDIDSWKLFFNDLSGNNDDRAKVDFFSDAEIDKQLLTWVDFWSRGNHDDRTLAIIY